MNRAGERRESGEAMVVWCLLLALTLLPLAGLSIDLWHGIAVQRQLQAAAEDAALAGASGVDVATYRSTGCILLDPSSSVALAQENLAQQDLGPSLSARFSLSTDGDQLFVQLREPVQLSLLSLVLGSRPLIVSAVAQSGPRGSLSGRGCPGGGQP